MKDLLLVVLNVRDLPAAMTSYRRLAVDQLHVRAHYEHDALATINHAVEQLPYRRFSIVSDDCAVPPAAFAAVRDLARTHDAATGYCRLDDESPFSNITITPLASPHPERRAYRWATIDHVGAGPAVQRTWFAGMCLSTFSRDLLRSFPLAAYPQIVDPAAGYYLHPDGRNEPFDKGCASDFHLSIRLQNAGVPIMAARDGFCRHHKPANPTLAPALLCGRERPSTRFIPRTR